MLRTDRQHLSAAGRESRWIHVYDCRFANIKPPRTDVRASDTMDFSTFLHTLRKEFKLQQHDRCVLATTDRTVLDSDKFRQLPDGTTLYLLQREDQALPVATEEHITFRPHYNTLTEGGLYEYYSSEGHNPLSYALAELIDNSLSATAKNSGTRTIEIRMLFDETVGKPAVVVLDNGCGMTSKQLRNWAVYRLSKFTRENSTFASQEEGYVRPDVVPRSLNSDISYFGVGGKQAIFFIGNSTRMISKAKDSPDVHELVLSKEEFERKERNKEDVYSGIIKNRKPGDSSHIHKSDERFLHELIAEESGKRSFTAVVITGIMAEHIKFFKQDFAKWTRQLAHVYHYYIHGINGNDMRYNATNSNQLPKIDIQVTMRERPHACLRVMNLREVQDDMQTLYINATAATFEFKATTEQDSGTVEGVIRYHPFLYDRETYPHDPNSEQAPTDEDESGAQNQARGKRPIFECFWNGRLIPYTKVDEFDWCIKGANVPEECYSRFSGVLFTDDRFQVTTNKLTYMDLEMKVKNKKTIFTRIDKGQAIRCNIQKDFAKWLQHCHEKLDKQVKFMGFKEIITRKEVPTKKLQHPWAMFSSIELDGKIYKAGQLVKSQKTNPIHHGTVIRFLLYGEHKKDVFATGGEVEMCLEPKAFYDTTKTIPISKIDRTATDEAIKKNIDNDFAKLPDQLQVDWPDGNPWPQNAVRPAGSPLGALGIKILNKKGEAISRMPSVGHSAVIKLSVRLVVDFKGPKTTENVVSFVAQHSPKWGFWFRKIESLTKPGKYTLSLSTIISDSQATDFGGKSLPSFKLNFTIKEGNAVSFDPGPVSSPLRVGVPFDIPLQFKDQYSNLTVDLPNLQPELHCSDLDLSFEAVDTSGTTYTIKGVRARGKLLNYHQTKTHDLEVTLPGLKVATQIVKICVLPGTPHSLHVKTEDNPIIVENGNPVTFNVEIHDEAGNLTVNARQMVHCQIKGLTPVVVDCSSTGAGQILTKPINLKIVKGEPQNLKVYFSVPSQKNIAIVERELRVLPSTRVSIIKVFSRDDEDLLLRSNDKIEWPAGSALDNLFYRLYDEANRTVPLTAEIASQIMVNWKSEANVQDLVQGKLPDIMVPTQVEEQRSYQVSYQHQNVSVFFTIVPRPGEPDQLKATVPQKTVKLGEILSENIDLELADQYGNSTKTLTPNYMNIITVDAVGLDKSSVTLLWQSSNSSVGVTGVRFQSGTPGLRELCFTYLKYEARVAVEVTAGNPAQLKLVSGPEQPLQVINGHGIPKPFLVQLYDEWGNHTSDQRVTVEVQPSPPALKVTTADTPQPVDTEGKSSFTVTSVSGPKGYYQLEFKGSFNNKPIPGPSVNLTVLPDPNKPVSLKVEYNTAAVLRAGGVFPVFLVTVVSDEGISMTNFNPAAASMWLWEGAPLGSTPPPTTPELKCTKPLENERQDCFHFRNKEIPEHVGRYTVQFSLRVNETDFLYSKQIVLNVVANHPVKLAPDSQPAAPAVSCCTDIANRTLVENMTLRIMDLHGNPAGQDLSGEVVISITSSGNKSFPLFEGVRSRTCRVTLTEGKAHITRLAIMANSPGEDGCVYTLSFKPEVSTAHLSLTPFELTFHFYNDAVSQLKMTEMFKKKSELTASVAKEKEFFDDNEKLLFLLIDQVLTAKRKEDEFRRELIKSNMTVAQPISNQEIDTLLNKKNTEADMILQKPRRVCSIPDNFRGQQDVLGKVGQLAYVQDDAAAKVISWFIRGDMDCVITRTSEAARRIYRDTQGRQQVMPLDTVFVGENRPLPHLRHGNHRLFDPPGNPVYIRDLLIYPCDQESCKKAFKNILGETILIDDLESANNYRRLVVQNNTPCPTILTREGDLVSSKGKFGGKQNKAPPNVTPVFGAPLPQAYHTVRGQIDLLNQYRATVEKREKAEKDREEHLNIMKSPRMEQRQKDLKEKMMQLEELERQLGSKPMKRGLEDAGEPSGIITKRKYQN